MITFLEQRSYIGFLPILWNSVCIRRIIKYVTGFGKMQSHIFILSFPHGQYYIFHNTTYVDFIPEIPKTCIPIFLAIPIIYYKNILTCITQNYYLYMWLALQKPSMFACFTHVHTIAYNSLTDKLISKCFTGYTQ